VRSRVGALAAFLILLASASAHAQASADSNERNYFVGGRAAGMGGAYTALAGDESGWFYNPAGPAQATQSSMSLSVSLYGMVYGKFLDTLGPGQDFSYTSVNIVPSMVGSIKKLSPRWSAGFAVVAPSTLNVATRDQLPSGDTIVYSQQDQSIWAGPGVAWQATPRLRLGASLFGVMRQNSMDFTMVMRLAPADAGGTTGEFVELRNAGEGTVLSLTGVLGVQWQASDDLTLGLSLRAPAVPVYSKLTLYQDSSVVLNTAQGTVGGLTSSTQEVDIEGLTPRFRVAVGGAYRLGEDVLLALDYVLVAGDDRHILTHDVSVGAEVAFTDKVVGRAGLFTNMSSSRTDVAVHGDSHINQFGLALGAGLVSDHTETSLGLSATYGQGDAQAILSDPHQAVRTGEDIVMGVSDGEQLQIYLFLGTSYRF
jgi:hypothetical protein